MATPLVQNITTAGVDERMRRAVMGIAIVLGVLVVMASLEAPAWSVALLFVPLFFVVNLAYQGLFKT